MPSVQRAVHVAESPQSSNEPSVRSTQSSGSRDPGESAEDLTADADDYGCPKCALEAILVSSKSEARMRVSGGSTRSHDD
jgi:hypothetical protein